MIMHSPDFALQLSLFFGRGVFGHIHWEDCCCVFIALTVNPAPVTSDNPGQGHIVGGDFTNLLANVGSIPKSYQARRTTPNKET
jgi:hypothetical protein